VTLGFKELNFADSLEHSR